MVSGQIKSPVIILRELNYDLMFIKKDSLSNLITYYCWLFWFWDLVIYGIRMGWHALYRYLMKIYEILLQNVVDLAGP